MFIAMLIIMIIVSLLFGFVVFVLLKTGKKGDDADAGNVKQLLARRESKLVMDAMKCNDDEKKAELLNKLRRVRSAQMVIDELLKEEKAINDSIEAEELARKRARAAEKKARKEAEKSEKKAPAEAPVVKGGKPAQPDHVPAHRPEQKAHPTLPSEDKAEEIARKPEKKEKEKKPLFKKKDDNVFKPSDD